MHVGALGLLAPFCWRGASGRSFTGRTLATLCRADRRKIPPISRKEPSFDRECGRPAGRSESTARAMATLPARPRGRSRCEIPHKSWDFRTGGDRFSRAEKFAGVRKDTFRALFGARPPSSRGPRLQRTPPGAVAGRSEPPSTHLTLSRLVQTGVQLRLPVGPSSHCSPSPPWITKSPQYGARLQSALQPP